MAIPYFYADVTLCEMTLDRVMRRYLAWMMGVSPYEGSRERRLRLGIQRGWTIDDGVRGEDLAGEHDCQLQTRVGERQFLLRLRHRDPDHPIHIWTSAISLTIEENRIRVRHGALVSGMADADRIPPLTSPRIVRDLIAEAERKVTPRELYQPQTLITAADAGGLVDFVLLDRDRRLPIVLVTPTRDGEVAVDVKNLVERTRGMASVYQAQDDAASFAVMNHLASSGRDKRFGVYNGAIRLYEQHLAWSADPYSHPLWTADRLRSMGDDQASTTQALAVNLARRYVHRITPNDHFQAIESFDRAARRAAIEARRDAVQSQDDRDLLNEALSLNTRLERDLAELRASHQREAEEHQTSLDKTEQALAEAQAKATALAAALAARRPSDPGADLPRDRSTAEWKALRARLGSRFTLADALRSIAVAFPDRVTVLESAIDSAEDSDDYQSPERAAQLLAAFVGPYYEDLCAGKPDSVSKGCFGKDQFASTESETLGARGRALRTFTYEGREVEMLRHLKMGNGEGTATCLRIHFFWDSSRQRLVIGHCGRHLDFR